MSRKKPEFIPNFASDGKKPLGPAPRIGLSRKVRPSPKQFKSPLLNSPVNYPDYIGSSPCTPVNENSPLKEKIVLSSDTTTTPGGHSRIGKRKKTNCKKNLQQNFDDKTEDVDKDEAFKLDEDNVKEPEHPVQTSARKIPDSKKNKVGANKVSEAKILSKDAEDLKTLEDSVGDRKSSRKRAAKKDDTVEDTVKDVSPNSKKGKKTLGRNKKRKISTDTSNNDSVIYNLPKPAVTMDVQAVVEDIGMKPHGRQSNCKVIESDHESPPKLNAITPESNQSGNRNERAKTTPDCPVLSPVKTPQGRLTRNARKILAVNENSPEECTTQTEGGSTTGHKEDATEWKSGKVKQEGGQVSDWTKSFKAIDTMENEKIVIKTKKVPSKTNKPIIILDHSSDEDTIPPEHKKNKGKHNDKFQRTLKKATESPDETDKPERTSSTHQTIVINDDSSDDERLPLASFINSTNPRKIIIPRYRPSATSSSSLSSRLSLLKRSSTNLSDRSHRSVTDKMGADDIQLEVLRNEVETLQQQVEDKEKEVEAYAKKQARAQELQDLIKVWEQGSKDALIALHQKITAKGENIDMDVLLKKFNAPEDGYKFDSFNYTFV